MRRTELLQEVRQMRFEEAYGGWKRGRLTQEWDYGTFLQIMELSVVRWIANGENLILRGRPGEGADYISRERMDRSANARTERGASPRTRTAAAEMHRAREKAVRGGRGTGISAGAGSMYM